ncbi:ATP-binding protein [Marivirga arenosa]|uniref:histidine kinase n=1 Tax=Marivirga arenosa TaxID=3059076 RepID=A0AA51ZY11_9BACT|nr:ATP-binding protein [Marivirga sp. BKB1-2]WNB18792.1 ATP-binding protein [Marivirga sp. BKB1-2]
MSTKRTILLLIISLAFFALEDIYAQKNMDDSASYFINIANENWHNDLALSHNAAQQAFELIPRIEDIKIKADAYVQYGISFYTKLEYDSALSYYQKAVNLLKANKYDYSQYVPYLAAVLAKKGHFKDVFDLIEKEQYSLNENETAFYEFLLIKLSAAIKIGYTDHALKLINQLQQNGNIATEKLLNRFKSLQGQYYQLIASYKKSDSIFNKLAFYYKSTDNKMDLAETYLFLAKNAMEVSNYKESSKFLIKAQSIYEELNYEYGIALINLETGTLLSWMQRYNEASDYIFKALKVFDNNQNLNELQIAYYELGWIFYSLELEKRAKKYLDQALEIAREIQNYRFLGSQHNAYGSLYTDLEIFDSAIFHFDSAIYYEELTKNIKQISAAKFNKAVVLEKIGQDYKAIKLYRESYKVDSTLRNYAGLIEGEWVLGEYFMKKDQNDSALYYFNLGEKHAINLGEKYFLLKIYEAKANLYSKTNNFKLSTDYFQKALKTQKELSEETKTLELATLETSYDLKNKEKELTLLNLQKENNEKTIALKNRTIASQRNTLIVLAVGFILLLVISYIIFRYLKIRTKTNHKLRELNNEIQEKQEEIMAQSEELQEANQYVTELNEKLENRVKDRTLALENALSELDHFFYRASHDFRGPLTTLMGLVGISKGYDLPEEGRTLFNQVNITVQKLDGLVKKLQAVSFLGDFENLKAPTSINLKDQIHKITDEVVKRKSFDRTDYQYDVKVYATDDKVIFYPVLLEICLSNLVENSLIFNYTKSIKIRISAEVKNEELILSVADNGIGISEDMKHEIFNMFKRTSQISSGNGLGLYIVKKATEILNGDIKLKSKQKEGSTFTITFPLSGITEIAKKYQDKVYSSS